MRDPTPDEVNIELARRGLLDFTTYTFPKYVVGWHHRELCDVLDRFVKGEIPRLIITMPPRHGKSELVSRRLPARIFGRNPDASVIACSYIDTLASRMNRDVQRIIDSDAYRRVYPKVWLEGSNVRTQTHGKYLRNSDVFEIVGFKGQYISAGIGGGITGMGGDFLLIDDPVKNQEEASSPTYRAKAWEWYVSTLYPRLEGEDGGEGCILLTMTRWDEDDLAGRLIQLSRDDPEADQWTVFNFPAICEDPEPFREIGDPLWPYKYALPRLKKIKATAGSRVWNALYQQRPSALEGNIIKKLWERPYMILPEKFDQQWFSWDLRFGDSKARGSYVNAQLWGSIGANVYLIDQIRGRWSFVETIKFFVRFCAKWPRVLTKLIEEKANGSALMSILENKIGGLIKVNPTASKEARLSAVSPMFEAGNVLTPHESIAPWIAEWWNEVKSFPNAKFDDQVDCTSQALQHFQSSYTVLDYDPDRGSIEYQWGI